MHAFSILTLGIFVAGYSTARWDLTTRIYELAIFAWDHGVVARAAKGFGLLSAIFFLLVLPFAQLAIRETDLVGGAAPWVSRERLTSAASSNLEYRNLRTRTT
jgi:hypothetical protein